MELKGKRVLVTGAGGFIGSHLIEELLKEGARVTCFIRYTSSDRRGYLDALPQKQQDALTIIKGDLKDADGIRAAMRGIEVVFHLGAMIAIPQSYEMPRDAVETNVLGTFNVLIAARDAGVKRVIHTSTSEVYGTALKIPITEEHPLQGQSPYSASKIGADKIAESFYLAYGLPVTIVRPFNTFGPRQSSRAVIPTIITQALAGKEIRLGTTKTTRDFLYVRDTARGFVAAAKSDKAVGETINLGTGREISIEDVAKAVLASLGKKVPIVKEKERVRPSKSEVLRLCADAQKAKRLIGWTPQYTFEKGLSETIAWIRDNMEKYRVGEYTR